MSCLKGLAAVNDALRQREILSGWITATMVTLTGLGRTLISRVPRPQARHLAQHPQRRATRGRGRGHARCRLTRASAGDVGVAFLGSGRPRMPSTAANCFQVAPPARAASIIASSARSRSAAAARTRVSASSVGGAGGEWLPVDFEEYLRPFYLGSCGFIPPGPD
jgi:hypothetical protein